MKNRLIPQIDKVLMALKSLNEEQHKSYLSARYRQHPLVHEKRLSQARKTLRFEITTLKNQIEKAEQDEKSEKNGKDLVESCNQISLDIISLGCLRFRIGDDAEALSLKNKLLKFSSMLSSSLAELSTYLHGKSKIPPLHLLKNQHQVLEEAFHTAYPLNENEEVSLSLDFMDFEFEEDPVSFRYDDAYSALQAFIYTAYLTCQNIEILANALAPWRKSL